VVFAVAGNNSDLGANLVAVAAVVVVVNRTNNFRLETSPVVFVVVVVVAAAEVAVASRTNPVRYPWMMLQRFVAVVVLVALGVAYHGCSCRRSLRCGCWHSS